MEIEAQAILKLNVTDCLTLGALADVVSAARAHGRQDSDIVGIEQPGWAEAVIGEVGRTLFTFWPNKVPVDPPANEIAAPPTFRPIFSRGYMPLREWEYGERCNIRSSEWCEKITMDRDTHRCYLAPSHLAVEHRCACEHSWR